MKEKVEYPANGVEFYPEAGTLLLIRCPKCGRENWAVEVASGFLHGADMMPMNY